MTLIPKFLPSIAVLLVLCKIHTTPDSPRACLTLVSDVNVSTAYDAAGNSNNATVTVTINNATPPPTIKKCDFNTDTRINNVDLSILLSNFNKTVPPNTKGDCNGDGKVTSIDLFTLLGLFGK